MRGGALVVLGWSVLLGALFLAHWLYAGEPTQIAITGASLGVIVLWGIAAGLAHRETIRRGPPPPRPSVQAIPDFSFAAASIGFSLASIGFGFVWGRFLTYFGAGLLVISLVRLAIELRSERRTLRANDPPAALQGSLRGSRPGAPEPAADPPVEQERPAR
jgi:peptidoglycan/LPS O-acetylase OafA/YrhL